MRHYCLLAIVSICFNLTSYSQRIHFTVDLVPRMDNNNIYLDVVTKEDYNIASFQFGFKIDPTKLEYLRLINTLAPNFEVQAANAQCKSHVSIVGHLTSVNYINLPKGTILLSLELHELAPVEHRICMLAGNNNTCHEISREVTDCLFNFYIVDDACIDYKIDDNSIVLTGTDDNINDANIKIVTNGNKINILSDEVNLEGSTLTLTNSFGNVILSKNLKTLSTQQIDIAAIPKAVYFTSILKDGIVIKTQKIIL